MCTSKVNFCQGLVKKRISFFSWKIVDILSCTYRSLRAPGISLRNISYIYNFWRMHYHYFFSSLYAEPYIWHRRMSHFLVVYPRFPLFMGHSENAPEQLGVGARIFTISLKTSYLLNILLKVPDLVSWMAPGPMIQGTALHLNFYLRLTTIFTNDKPQKPMQSDLSCFSPFGLRILDIIIYHSASECGFWSNWHPPSTSHS